MNHKKHPYQELERLKAWKILDRAIKDLAANGDLEELTARRYIVGYLLQKLHDAQALALNVIVANGVQYHPDPEPANRG